MARSSVCPVGRLRAAAVALTVVMMLVSATSGCVITGRVGDVAPGAGQPSAREPLVAVDAPDASLANHQVVAAARGSVVKIRGLAHSCTKVLEGSGFVVGANRVMAAAHVVAGTDSITVQLDGITYDAQVVLFDPNADISILDVPNLTAQALAFRGSPALSGTDAVMLGYPGGGTFVATPARIREVIELSSSDIYRTTTVTREVYTIRGAVRQGDSGGPLIDLDGRVLGVVFGAAVDDPDTGFVLTSGEVAPQLAEVGNSQPVATGACIN
jgi:S1-C subfamily serine protease